ncbi:lysophosphatidylcholine acyltransferase isoform X1 [Achroia grisella]|uniref:lysophosphatidylcholine acyltransferase isoform X1 n=1 Tax=Achroia grisella TaxID=688607 RepID=UPI0027D2932D|nr:lysophosphatidylcholine acyltransferase isoform X1 [Achroia grisella]
MNGKLHSETGAFSSDGMRAEILNPFVHKLELDNTYDKIKTAIFTVILLPFRVIVICYLIVTAWFLACIGLYGLSEEDLRRKPMTGWRSKLRFSILSLMRLVVVAAGFHRIKVLGKHHLPANSRDAPVVVMAPHSSFFDAIAIVCLGAPSVVAKADTARLPFIGQLINYTQPVYVWRDDPNSRQNTIKEIIERATSKEDWPQVLIFPEGTCTNRSCLITFKPGGFYPGVPVQPVIIRYPNSMDTVTWTWEGPGALKLLWLTLTQVHSSCEIEFLPVYYPNQEEKNDPKLYARNVRDVMAKALGVPVLDYTYDDCRLIARAKQLGIPGAAAAREVSELRAQLGVPQSQLELQTRCVAAGDWVTREQFVQRLGVPIMTTASIQAERLFQIFEQRGTGMARWSDYMLCAAFLSLQHAPLHHLICIAFKLYDSGFSRLNQASFEELATKCLGMCQEDAHHLFRQIDSDEKGCITYDEFMSYAQKRPELSFIFASDATQQKSKSQ